MKKIPFDAFDHFGDILSHCLDHFLNYLFNRLAKYLRNVLLLLA